LGGFVTRGRVLGVLAVSRAFGDNQLKERVPRCISSEPDIQIYGVQSVDEFIVIACDGLWDVFSSVEAVVFVRNQLKAHGDLNRIATLLAESAIAKGSQDNVSVIIVKLQIKESVPLDDDDLEEMLLLSSTISFSEASSITTKPSSSSYSSSTVKKSSKLEDHLDLDFLMNDDNFR
jgi:serine/threonine protein phosphatase PrpC